MEMNNYPQVQHSAVIYRKQKTYCVYSHIQKQFLTEIILSSDEQKEQKFSSCMLMACVWQRGDEQIIRISNVIWLTRSLYGTFKDIGQNSEATDMLSLFRVLSCPQLVGHISRLIQCDANSELTFSYCLPVFYHSNCQFLHSSRSASLLSPRLPLLLTLNLTKSKSAYENTHPLSSYLHDK